jgi:hypothetical protein
MDYYPSESIFQNANVQSSIEPPEVKSTEGTEVHQTVGFNDEIVGEVAEMDTIIDPTRDVNKTTNTELGDFLRRPVLINSSTWTAGATYANTFNPWSDWMSNPQVKKKIDNYAYFRGTLKLKFIINASPFYYGAAIAAYTPLTSWNTPVGVSALNRIPISQKPHIMLYPQTNSGGELTLPFFYHKDWLDITNLSEVTDMGQITMYQYRSLGSANGASTTGVTIQVFAWCEDPVLSAPTAMLTLQSRDEYGNGPVSRPSAIVANIAKRLTTAPIIGPFAKATEIGASAVSSIARIFGFSNPPVVDNPQPVFLQNLPVLASAEISHPNHRFTLDPKAEMSIDPKITGVDLGDEMALSSIITRESWLTTISWSTSDSFDTLLYNMAITPDMKDVTVSTNYTTVYQTPLAFAFAPFAAWRGDIRLRFKVICSKYHKGRIAFTYDPKANLVTNGLTSTMNTCFTRILDISESDEIIIDVPYLQESPFIDSGTNTTSRNFQTSSFTNLQNDLNNGTITIRVLNNLSAPVDTSSVNIFCYVSGGDNMVFANPIDLPQFTYASVQSKCTEETLVETTDTDERFLVNYNEPIGSIRKLLRRYQFVDSTAVLAINAGALRFEMTQNRMPPDYGYFGNGPNYMYGVVTTTGQYPASYVANTYISWFKGAYVAHRGSIKWSYNYPNMLNNPGSSNFDVTRLDTQPSSALVARTYTNTPTSMASYQASAQKFCGGSGRLVVNEKSGAGLSFEHNMYNHYRMASCLPMALPSSDFDGNQNDNHQVSLKTYIGANYPLRVERYAAIGTDFSFHFFLCVPRVYIITNPPVVTTPSFISAAAVP